MNTVADRHRHAAYHNKHWWITLNDLEPWKYWFSVIFLAIFGCKIVNYDKMDKDKLRLLVNRNCYRLSRVSRALLKLLVLLTLCLFAYVRHYSKSYESVLTEFIMCIWSLHRKFWVHYVSGVEHVIFSFFALRIYIHIKNLSATTIVLYYCVALM